MLGTDTGRVNAGRERTPAHDASSLSSRLCKDWAEPSVVKSQLTLGYPLWVGKATTYSRISSDFIAPDSEAAAHHFAHCYPPASCLPRSRNHQRSADPHCLPFPWNNDPGSRFLNHRGLRGRGRARRAIGIGDGRDAVAGAALVARRPRRADGDGGRADGGAGASARQHDKGLH